MTVTEAAPVHHPAVVEHQERRAADVQLRVADAITKFAGSMMFVYVHIVLFVAWMLIVEKNPWPTLTLGAPGRAEWRCLAASIASLPVSRTTTRHAVTGQGDAVYNTAVLPGLPAGTETAAVARRPDGSCDPLAGPVEAASLEAPGRAAR
jgi:hypothetical protein